MGGTGAAALGADDEVGNLHPEVRAAPALARCGGLLLG